MTSTLARSTAMALCVVCPSLFAGCLSAQSPGTATEQSSPRLREACRRSRDVVATVRSGSYDTTAINALAILGRCRVSAGAVVPQLWSFDVADRRGLAALIAGSRGIRDARIFAAAARVAEDPSRPRVMRQAALIVIASYVKRGLSAGFEEYRFPGAPEELGIYPTYLGHANSEEGDQPMPGNPRGRVEAILKSIASQKRGALEDLARQLLNELSV